MTTLNDTSGLLPDGLRARFGPVGLEAVFARQAPKIAIVMGNGPSAEPVDFDPLRLGHLASVGMDAAYRDWAAIGFHPTYYVCMDLAVLEAHSENIVSMVKEGKTRKFFLRDELKQDYPELQCHERIYWLSQALADSEWFRASHMTTGSWAARWMLHEGMRLVALFPDGSDGEADAEAMRELSDDLARLGRDAKLIDLGPPGGHGVFGNRRCADFFRALRLSWVTSFRANLDADALADNLAVAAANCANPFISRVHLLLEGTREQLVASLDPGIAASVRELEASGRLQMALIGQRPSYQTLFEYANSLGPGCVVVANSDIVLPYATAAQAVIDRFSDAAPLCAITRWNLTDEGVFLQGLSGMPPWPKTRLEDFHLTGKNPFSFDTYLFEAPLAVPPETGEIRMGTFGCDTALAALFKANGTGVGNPCLAYQTIHIDDKPRDYQRSSAKNDELDNIRVFKRSLLSRYAGCPGISASLGGLDRLGKSVAWIGGPGISDPWNAVMRAVGATPWSASPALPQVRFQTVSVSGAGGRVSCSPDIQGLVGELSGGNVFVQWELSGFDKDGHICDFLAAQDGCQTIGAQIRGYHWQSSIHLDRATPEQRSIHADILGAIRELLAVGPVAVRPAKKVSILLSCFDGTDWVEGYVDALLHPEISSIATLIAIDFPFSHRDPGFVERQLRRYPDLVLVRKQQNVSLYDAWNEAIGLATTEFVGNLNLDDRVATGYYAKAVAALEGLAGDVFSSYALRTGEPGDWEKRVGRQEHVPPGQFGGQDIIAYGLESLVTLGDGRIVKRNPPHCAPVWRRSLHRELGWFESRTFDFCADYAFWLKVAAAGKKMLLSRELLTLFYSASGTASDRLMHPESEAILERWKPAFPPKGYTPSRLGERNNFLHFCLNMNAIFASPRYHAHLGDVTGIDARYAIGLAQGGAVAEAGPMRFTDALLARCLEKTPPKVWRCAAAQAGGQALWQARFDQPEGTEGREFVAGLALRSDQAAEVQAVLAGTGGVPEEARQAVTLAPGVETEIRLRLACSGQHPALRMQVDAPGLEAGLTVRSVYLDETLASLRSRIPAGRIDLKEANRLFRAGDFQSALHLYLLLHERQPFQIYLDNALWCACKLGLDLSCGADGLARRHV